MGSRTSDELPYEGVRRWMVRLGCCKEQYENATEAGNLREEGRLLGRSSSDPGLDLKQPKMVVLWRVGGPMDSLDLAKTESLSECM